MAQHNSHSNGQIRNPGVFPTPSGLKTTLIVFVFIGIAAFALGLSTDPTRTWATFVMNHFFFLCLALGGIFFAAIQWLTGAMWSAPVRRFSEAYAAYLPIAAVMFIILIFGFSHIYPWTNLDHMRNDLVLKGKMGYLCTPSFVIRNLGALAIWIFFSWRMIGNSIAQDKTGDYALTLKNRVLSPVYLVLFGLTFTIASFDLMMSLDPHWYSTIFGVYCFAGLFYANLASVCLMTLYFKRKGLLDGIVNDNHLHDLGKFMFAFTVFWAYIGFAQFMLIWYANLPEETGYYLHRFHDGWLYVSLFLLVGKFMVPFFFLLPRGPKRNEFRLAAVAVFMLIAEWIDIMWMVQPEFFADGPRFGIIELGVTIGFLGVFGLVVARFLARNNIIAIGDPRLAESVYHHHQ